MTRMKSAVVAGLWAAAFSLPEGAGMAASRDLGGGVLDHGVAAPVARSRGAAATADGAGRNVILVFLSDHRACTSLLVIEAETGKTRQIETPPHTRDSPFAVILSSANRFLSHFGGTFMEFDPGSGAFTFAGKTEDRVAMSMTEDSQGVIWSATYPNCHVVSYNPNTRELTDHGSLNRENWRQYPRSMAAGNDGWIYVGIGSTRSHLLAYHPKTKRVSALAEPAERIKGGGAVVLGKNGNVYGRPNPKTPWFELRQGQRGSPVDSLPPRAEIRTGTQSYVHDLFPDGARLVELKLPAKRALIQDAGAAQPRRLTFDYHTEGSHVVSLGAGPDGKIYGTTGHPLHVYCYDPAADTMSNHGLLGHNGHWNAVTSMGSKLYGGEYVRGILWEYDPAKDWAPADQAEPNPRRLANSLPAINRPHALLAHPNGRHLILTGTPGYGHTGGGMNIYDLQADKPELLSHDRLIPNQATFCLEALSADLLIGGTSITPGTGGETLANEAELYLFDFPNRKIVWHEPVLPGAATIRDLVCGPDGRVYGMAGAHTFFVFDAATRQVIHREPLEDYGGLAGGQAPRCLLMGPDAMLYAYFQKAIVRIDPANFRHEVAVRPEIDIHIGVALVQGRFYFGSGSHVYSCPFPN